MQSSRPLRIHPGGAGYLNQYFMGFLNTADGTATKVHIKTSMPKGTGANNVMVTFEAVGFAYGSAQAIRSSWCLYQYQSTLYSMNGSNVYPGMVAEGIYYSADNFVCLRGGLSGYFSGFMLNAYVGNGDGAGTLITIQDAAWNTNAGAHF
jgi:hypothetical protein